MENKHCPRCKAALVCNASDVSNCQCSGLVFTAVQKEQIGTAYTDCLCRKCLIELQQMDKALAFD